MEPVTHMLVGAGLSRAGLNRKTGYATLAMVIAAEAPDLDMLWGIKGPVAELQHHRGITHSFLGAPFMALGTLLLVMLCDRLRRKRPLVPVRWGWIFLCALIADLSHILLDYTTSYGVRPWFPFHAHWYAASIVYLFDPFLFLVLLLAIIVPALLALRRKGQQGLHSRGWSWAALCLVVLWWGVRFSQRTYAEALVKNSAYLKEPIERIAAEPYMASPFHWKVLIDTGSAYRIADVETLPARVAVSPEVFGKPPVTAAMTASEHSYLGRVFLDWSKWPLITDRGTTAIPTPAAPPPPSGQGWHAIEFLDLRFNSPDLARGKFPRKAGSAPLIGWVYVTPRQKMQGMYMHGEAQPLHDTAPVSASLVVPSRGH